MKTNAILVTTALILGSSVALAASQQQEAPQPDAKGSMSMEGMTGGCMPMHDNMDKMQAQIDAINEATDPDKRAELIEAHMNSMNEMMQMSKKMHSGKGMMDKGEMGEGMKMGHMTHDKAAGEENPTSHEQHHEQPATD